MDFKLIFWCVGLEKRWIFGADVLGGFFSGRIMCGWFFRWICWFLCWWTLGGGFQGGFSWWFWGWNLGRGLYDFQPVDSPVDLLVDFSVDFSVRISLHFLAGSKIHPKSARGVTSKFTLNFTTKSTRWGCAEIHPEIHIEVHLEIH